MILIFLTHLLVAGLCFIAIINFIIILARINIIITEQNRRGSNAREDFEVRVFYFFDSPLS